MNWHIPPDLVIGPTFGTRSAAPSNWGMGVCYVDRIRAAGGDGTGETVAILDTGIDLSHPEFAGRITASMSFVPGEGVSDGNGHGTHCAGTAAGATDTIGVSNRPKILAGKCLSNGGSGSSDWIANAFRWALQSGATVISMSIGGPGFLDGMESLFREANSRGVIPVVAAGNERQQGGVVRTASSGIVVAAVDSQGNYATFSNPASNGSILSIAAPGVNIVSARPGGGYQSMSGTSMATPFVAGVVAAVQSARVKAGLSKLTTAEFKAMFARRAIDAGQPGPDRDYGPGLIDCNLFALSLVNNPEVK
jgi:subtilisin family serine protease